MKRARGATTIIDKFEIEIDEMAIQPLTKAPLAKQPASRDRGDENFPRIIERIGDEATKIAKRARDLTQKPPVKVNLDLPQHGQRRRWRW